MEYPIHIDTISMELSILYFQWVASQNFYKMMYFCPLKVVFIWANSADPDEMLHNAAFHLRHHCLPKYLFTGFQIEKGLRLIIIKV